MRSPIFGEFMGTLVLILLGNGVVANVLLKKSKAEGSGWIVVTSGWAFAVMAGVFTAIACGSTDAYLNPAVTVGMAVTSGNFTKFPSYFAAELAARWSEQPSVAAFLSALEGNSGRGFETSLFLYGARNSQRRCKSAQRDHRHICAGAGCRRNLFESGRGSGSSGGSGTIPCVEPGLGHWSFAGRNDWLCDQSCAGFGAANRTYLLPIAGKGDSDWRYAAIPVLGPLTGGLLAGLFIRLVHF